MVRKKKSAKKEGNKLFVGVYKYFGGWRSHVKTRKSDFDPSLAFIAIYEVEKPTPLVVPTYKLCKK